jgi:hypothetical protein
MKRFDKRGNPVSYGVQAAISAALAGLFLSLQEL